MWQRLSRGYDGTIAGLGLLAGAIFAVMAVGICVDVLLRNVAGRGVGWLIELMEYAMLVATLLAAPWVLREGAHVTVDIVVSRLPPASARVVRSVALSLGLLICTVMLYYGWLSTWLALQRGSMVFKSIVFPEWWLMALVPLGMALLATEFARLLWRELRAREPG